MLWEKVRAKKLDRLYEDIERPLIGLLAQMEIWGVRVDPGVLKAMSRELETETRALEKRIHELAGGAFNINSPQQLGQDSNWIDVAAGAYFTLGLRKDLTLWSWGSNKYGQLGDRSNTQRDAPVQVTKESDWIAVAAGDFHASGPVMVVCLSPGSGLAVPSMPSRCVD